MASQSDRLSSSKSNFRSNFEVPMSNFKNRSNRNLRAEVRVPREVEQFEGFSARKIRNLNESRNMSTTIIIDRKISQCRFCKFSEISETGGVGVVYTTCRLYLHNADKFRGEKWNPTNRTS